jgi:hypothetical protein
MVDQAFNPFEVDKLVPTSVGSLRAAPAMRYSPLPDLRYGALLINYNFVESLRYVSLEFTFMYSGDKRTTLRYTHRPRYVIHSSMRAENAFEKAFKVSDTTKIKVLHGKMLIIRAFHKHIEA